MEVVSEADKMLLREFRRRAEGRSQEEMARELGITQGTVSRILTGAQPIGLFTAQRMALTWPELTLAVMHFFLSSDMRGGYNRVAPGLRTG